MLMPHSHCTLVGSLEELVSGALESSFWVMDSIILHDKETIRFLLFFHSYPLQSRSPKSPVDPDPSNCSKRFSTGSESGFS